MPIKTKFIIFFPLFTAIFPIRAEVIWGPTIERNGGEYIFETGNRFPNLSGIRGGSRISFPRTTTEVGLHGAYFKNKWEIRAALKSTTRYQHAGQARDEDFVMSSQSQERGTNIATREWAYYDSASVYSGTRNFADGIGKASVSQNKFEAFGRYYFQEASPDYWTQGSGLFLTTGFRYSYFKYIFYDVNQFVDSRPVFYGPIGLGLTYSNDLYELFYGAGYRNSIEDFYLDVSFTPSIGRIRTRDFHVQRSINFLSDNFGFGWQTTAEVGYKINSSWLSYLKLSHRRFFSEGRFQARGGLSQEDIASNFVSGFKSHINIKDFSIELGFLNKISWDLPETKQKEEEIQTEINQ